NVQFRVTDPVDVVPYHSVRRLSPTIPDRVFGALFSALEISITHSAVEVEARIFDILIKLEVGCAFVDGLDGGASEISSEWSEVADRIQHRVESVSDTVANRERRQERYHEVRPRPDAIGAQRLAGVRVTLLDSHASCYIEQSADTDGRVEHKASRLATGSR